MKDFGIVTRRPDGSFVVTRYGLPYHVPNEGGFAELWSEVNAWALSHPEQVAVETVSPETVRAEAIQTRLEKIKAELAALDNEYLTLRVLAGLAIGDGYARGRYEKHETAAAPLRAELADLNSGVAYAEN